MLTAARLEKEGARAFRMRSFLPLAMLALCILSLSTSRYSFGGPVADAAWQIICVAVGLLGLAIRFYTVGFAPEGTSGRNREGQVAKVLTTDGLYSAVRNPLYLGNFWLWLAIVLMARSPWVTLIFLLSFTMFYERVLLVEESFLKGKFGAEYLDWAGRTPALIPSLKNWMAPVREFSWNKAWREEYRTFFALYATAFLMEVMGDYFSTGKLAVQDVFWRYSGIAAVTLFLAIRLRLKVLKFLERQSVAFAVERRP